MTVVEKIHSSDLVCRQNRSNNTKVNAQNSSNVRFFSQLPYTGTVVPKLQDVAQLQLKKITSMVPDITKKCF